MNLHKRFPEQLILTGDECQGRQDSREVSTLTSEPSRMCLKRVHLPLGYPASQAGQGINVIAVPRMDAKVGIPSASMSQRTLKNPTVSYGLRMGDL